jgi:hypothetical protein
MTLLGALRKERDWPFTLALFVAKGIELPPQDRARKAGILK